MNALGFRRARGFTLIELLVVIAIVAILLAILVPTYFKVQEAARQKVALSNLTQIHAAYAAYVQANHHPPPVLFGYVVKDANGNVVPMDQALAAAQKAGTVADNFPGLYPVYINDATVFQDPNDKVPLTQTVDPAVNVLCPNGRSDDACRSVPAGTLAVAANTRTTGGTAVPLAHGFYAADAFDSSPEVAADGTLDTTTYVPRYQPAWTSIGAAPNADYLRQLVFPNAPADAFITCDTWHAPNGKVLALFAGGNVKAIPPSRFLSTGADVPSIAAASGQSPAQFWRVKP